MVSANGTQLGTDLMAHGNSDGQRHGEAGEE